MYTYSKRRMGHEEDAVSRREAIVDLVATQRIANQAELGQQLAKRGFHTTQATLSRDLRSLGIGKRPGPGGTVYALPAPAHEVLDTRRQHIEIASFVQHVRVVGNMAIVRTPPGNAHGVARTLDLLGWDEVAGTLAGDDTILVIAADRAAALRFRRRLSEMAGRELG
jgi:transcriptional regulator of arginine metabolism